MVSTEEILITLLARDNASPVFEQVAGNASTQLSGMSSSIGSSFGSLGSSATGTFDNIRESVGALNTGMMGLSSASNMLFQELGAKKSASDYVYGTSAKEDTNKVLLSRMRDSEEQGESMLNTIDTATDNALVSMQDLIPALNVIQSSTGATGQEIENVSNQVAQFGSFVLAQTGSVELASTAMDGLAKGIKGAFDIIDDYGISESALENVGWNGDEEDLQGFMDAVSAVIGDTSALMDTSEGLDAQMGKMWSRAGKQIGRELLPHTKSLKTSFLELDRQMGGQLSKSILLVQFGIEELQGKLYQVSATMEAINNVSEGFGRVKSLIFGIGESATQSADAVSNLANATSDVAQMGTNVGVAGTEAMASGGQAVGQVGGGVIGGGGEIVGDFSTLGLDYMDDLRAQNPTEKLAVNRKMMEDMLEEATASIPKIDGKPTAEQFLDATRNFNYKGNELDEAKALLGKQSSDLYSYGAMLDYHNNIIDDLEDKIRYVTESTDFSDSSNVIRGLGGEFLGVTGQSQGNQNALDSLRQQLEEQVTQKALMKDAVEKALKDDPSKNVTEILEDFAREGVLDGLDISGVDADDEASKTLSQAIRGKFSAIRESVTSAVGSIKSIPTQITGKFKEVKGSLKSMKDNVVGLFTDEDESFGQKLDRALYNPFRKVPKAPDVSEVVDDVENVTTGASNVGKSASKMKGVAPAMAEGAVEGEAVAVAETSLSGAFTSMLIPTLAIAGVIAILIPIVAGLVIEALFFASLVGQVMQSFNWDFDIDGVGEKLSELAMAMAWLGVAMASMSFAGFMTGIAFLLTGFGNVKAVIGQAVTMLKDASTELNQLGGATVDPSVATNLTNLGNALNGISMAMMSLTGVTLSSLLGNLLTFGGMFGSLSDNLRNAKTDLQEAINTINQMDFGGIDETKVKTISTVMEAIGNFGSAFDGLLKIRDGAKWSNITNMLLDGIFGTSTETVQQAFQNAHKDLQMASQELQYYTDLETVDEETANKIKNVADALEGIAGALDALSKLKEDKGFMGAIDSFLNGSNDDLMTGLDNALKVVRETATKLAKLGGEKGGLAEIDENIIERIQTITEILTKLSEALTQMQSIKTLDKNTKLDKLPEVMGTAITTLQTVGTKISKMEIPESDKLSEVSDKVKTLTNAIKEVSDALTGIQEVNTLTGGWDFKALETKFGDIGSSIGSFASELNNLGKTLSDESHSIPEDLSSKLADISGGASQLSQAVAPMNSMPQVDGQNIGFKVARAVTGVKNASTYLKTINKANDVGSGISTIITNIGSGFNSLKSVALTMNAFPQVDGQNIGYKVARAVTGVKRASTEMKKLASSDKVNNIESVLSSVRSSVTSLKNTLNKMSFSTQGKNIGTSIRTGLGTGIGNLAPIFHSKLTAGVNGSGAWTAGKNMGTSITNGVKSSAKLSQIFKDEMTHIKESLDANGEVVASAKAMAQAVVEGAREGAESHSPGAIARMWGEEMGYSSQLMLGNSGGLIRTARNVASNVVTAFNTGSTLTPKLMNFDAVRSDLNKAQVQTMMELRRPSNMGNPQRPVNITVGEGAVQLDARSMSRKESRQIMINALEGLDAITGIEVDKTI